MPELCCTTCLERKRGLGETPRLRSAHARHLAEAAGWVRCTLTDQWFCVDCRRRLAALLLGGQT